MNIITFPTGNVGIGTETPNSTLEIAGTLRLTGSTGTGETLMGRNNLGDVSAITIGSGLSLSANTLTSTGGGGGGISGTGTTNYIPKWGSGTSLADSVIFQSGTSVGIGTTTLSSDRLDIQGTSASEGGQIGAELMTTGSGTNWTGISFASGYTHTTGNTAALTSTISVSNASYYQVNYTVSGRTFGTVNVSVGGVTSGNVSASGSLAQSVTSATAVTVAPSTDFDGAIILSVKRITASTMATFALKNSSGTVVYEQRAMVSSYNTSIGVGAGSFNTVGLYNISIGFQAGYFNTQGTNNVNIGYLAGQKNSAGKFNFMMGSEAGVNNTGSYNNFIGYKAGTVMSGQENTFIGTNTGETQTTGNSNTYVGTASGYYILGGSNNTFYGHNSGVSAGKTSISECVLIGKSAINSANSQTNAIAIGHNSVTLTSNSTAIGNTSTTRAKIWGSFENQSSSTSNANTSLLIQNSATRALLTVKDGGVIEIGANVTVTGNTTATIQATDSTTGNVGIALAPKGSGAFTLSIPDGTSAGGNLRGGYAVDLQTSRSLATQVAGGQYSVIGGGNSNVTSEYYSGSVIAGGGSNTIIKDKSVISGGSSNIINSSAGVISGGENNILESNANYASVVGGKQGIAYLYGQTSRASGALATQGDAQTSEFIVRRIVTGTGATELFLDGVSLRAELDYSSTTNRLWNLVANTSAMVLSGDTEPLSKGHSWVNIKFAGIKKVNTTTSLVGSPSSLDTLYDGGMNGSSISLTADDTNDALIVQFAPPLTATAATVIYVVTTIKITEVGFN